MTDVLVIGSINADVTFRSAHFAAPGETVVAEQITHATGGKGANQAVAVARAGAAARLVGAVGEDPAGRTQVEALAAEGVDTDAITVSGVAPTGTAFVVVVSSGENSIVVGRGANATLDPERVRAEVSTTTASVLLLSSEAGEAIVDAAAGAAADAGTPRVVVNNGPWLPLAPRSLAVADPLVVNEHEARHACPEAAELSGTDLADAVRHAHGSRSVVVTHGSDGVALSGDLTRWFDAVPASVVADTTGAGDAFVGTLAAALARGTTLEQAVRLGQEAGARAVSRHGAR
ncbi:PfkB family carbohydrate kinase [Nocardioides oleivorans]|uniref:PfkB family carbohydrate kinase n=1 Tax=Nocardioides oleivorans TaxID=273676 RepID=UPI0013EAB69E|nr:PfkB family carbohydrate kinase [Nocardioides oleivorans]